MRSLFKQSSFSNEREQKIQEIHNLFGQPNPNDRKPEVNSQIVSKGITYKVTNVGIKIPSTQQEIADFNNILKMYEMNEFLNKMTAKPANFSDYHEDHPEIDASPYEDCFTYLRDLLADTKDKLENYIIDLESETGNNNRLDKLNFIAFYRPFHFWPTSWGIYMDTQKLISQARRIFYYNQQNNVLTNLTFGEALKMSFFKTYYHELYHHKFEMLGTKMEMVLREPVYKEGFHKFYCETFDTDYCLEEAFANVYGLNKSIAYLRNKLGFIYDPERMKKLIRESLLRPARNGYRVAYEITSLNDPQFEEVFENKFIEILFDYTYQKLFGTPPTAVNYSAWEMFTYKLDPLVNTKNTVTFIIPSTGGGGGRI